MNEQDQKRQLLAHADDELTGQEKLAAQERVEADPNAAGAMGHQTQLREAVAKSMNASAPKMPGDLQDRITQLTQQADTEPIARIGSVQLMRWAPAIAAAVLLAVSAAIYFQTINQRPSTLIATDGPGAPWVQGVQGAPVIIMNAADSSRFTNRHDACTTMREQLQHADWPTSISELPVALTDHLGATPYKGMDLSKAGYQFAGAGPCMAPGEPSAHLIYRAAEGSNQAPISLWLRPDDGRYDIPEDVTHQVTTDNSASPIYIWRRSGVIYYMVGDTMDQVMKAKLQFAD